MAYWTIIGKGIEADLQKKSFGVTLDTDNQTWAAGGPNVDLFFVSKSGKFKFIVSPEKGTRLANDSGREEAFFRNLNVTSPVGADGLGRASEKGVNFSWKLDSK